MTRHRALWVFVLASLLLKSLIFEPIALWPVTFICLVPWLVMIGASTYAPRVYFYSYVFGLAFFLINMRWLYPATGAGYVAMSVYMAVYFPLVACPIRHVIRRRRWPLAIVFPIVWVGCELLRAVVMSGFPWFFLSHSFYKVLTLIQVSDLVGAYGVTFVAASVNGALADLAIAYLASRRRREAVSVWRSSWRSVVFTGVILVACLAYGQFQLHRATTEDGPKIALIQGDFASLVNPSSAVGHDKATSREKMRTYFEMMRAAAAEQPDLMMLPETPWAMFLNPESRDRWSQHRLSRDSFEALQAIAAETGAYIVTGSASLERYPLQIDVKERRYNSATVFYPDGREPGRYDKVHLVYFGEVVPFRHTRLHGLYLWLNGMMPFSGPDGTYEYSLFHGQSFRRFELTPREHPGQTIRFGIPICYEDVMPYVSREFVGGDPERKSVDMLLNISNDGWFGRGIQQPQHLAVSVFRAVENRVGIARAVNTGVSAFIDPSGLIHDVVTPDAQRRWPGAMGYQVANVKIDSRYALYSRYGDWFAWCCAVMWAVIFLDYWILRVRSHGGDPLADSGS